MDNLNRVLYPTFRFIQKNVLRCTLTFFSFVLCLQLTCPCFFLETSQLSHFSPSTTLPIVDSFIPRPKKIIHTALDGMEMKWPKEQSKWNHCYFLHCYFWGNNMFPQVRTYYLVQGLASCCPQAKACSVPVFVNKGLLTYSHAQTFTYSLWLFPRYSGRVCHGNRQNIAWKAKNCCLALYRKSLPTPHLTSSDRPCRCF